MFVDTDCEKVLNAVQTHATQILIECQERMADDRLPKSAAELREQGKRRLGRKAGEDEDGSVDV